MRKFSILLVFVYVTVFSLYHFVIAANPVAPIEPDDNIQDPGDPGTAWGGCGPLDSNCYVTVTSLAGPITIVNSSSLFSTGLTNTGDNSIAINSIFLGDSAGEDATNADRSNFFGINAGFGATNSAESNFFGPSAGSGATDASNSNFFGNGAGADATNATLSNFLGQSSGASATNANNSNFFGNEAGSGATNADHSNFFGAGAGIGATDANNSNFFGVGAGDSATGANTSNFFGLNAGSGAINAYRANFIGEEAGLNATDAVNSNFFGNGAGSGATSALHSTFIGQYAGLSAVNAANSIFIGENAGANDTVDNTTGGYSILLGPLTDTGNFSNSIAMGRGATNTASNQLIFGSSTANSYISSVFFGTGVTAASPQGVVINGSGASGSDIAGASLTLAGGKATGNASGGSIIFQTSVTDVSSSSLQSLSTKATLLANGNFGIGDTTPASMFTVGSGDLFQVNSAGAISATTGYIQGSGTMSLTSANTTQQTTSSIFALNGNSLTTGTGFYGASSTLSTGSLMNLVVTGTAATANSQKVLNISTSGANANANQTTYGGYFSNTHTGSGGLTYNRAIYATSSGGAVNTAVYAVASGGTTSIGLYATASGGTNNYAAQIDGILKLGSGNFLIEAYSDLSLSLGGASPSGMVSSLFFGSGAGTSATDADYSNFLGTGAGNGATNADHSNFLGSSAGLGATNADDSNFFGETAGYQVTAVDDANFFGYEAGYQATSATDSNFMGYRAGKLATNAGYSNFFGFNAGVDATNASSSVFIGANTGNGATNSNSAVFIGDAAGQNAIDATGSVFIGTGAGTGALNFSASKSVFLGYTTGLDARNADNSIFIGEAAGYQDSVDNSTGGYSILLGPNTDTGDFSNSIAMGRGATNTASNQLVFGSDDANSYIDNVWFGSGEVNASPVGVILNVSGGSGNDIAGGSFTIASGRSTGNALGGSIIFQTSDAGATGNTLRSLSTKMTLLGNGFLGINDTTPDYRLDIETDVASYVANFFNDGNATTRSGILIQGGLDDSTAAGPSTLIGFQDGDGGAIGSITFGSSATAYNTTSDQRLKTTVNERTNSSLDLLNQIQIHDFIWKNDNHDNIYTGVYAQELYDIYPHAVTKPVNPNDNWMVDYSKLTPVVVASIQDLDIKLNDIENFAEENNSFGDKLRNWLADSTNGIEDLYASVIHSKKAVVETLCVGTEEDKTCITKDQLDALLLNGNSSNTNEDSNIGDIQIITGDDEVVSDDLPAQTEENPEEPIIEEPVIEETIEEPIVEESIAEEEVIP